MDDEAYVNGTGLTTAVQGVAVIKHWCRKQKTGSLNKHFQNVPSGSGCALGIMEPRHKA